MNIQNIIKKIQESESYKKFKNDLDEMSVTGMVAGYQTPKAFSPKSGEGKESFDRKTKDNAEQFGYKIAKKQKRKQSIDYKTFANNAIKKPIGKKVNEVSNTPGVAQMNIGDSFISGQFEDENAKRPHPTMRKTVESAGYKSIHGLKGQPSVYKTMMTTLHESSYKDYKRDKSRTTNEKINYSIKELNNALMQVERAVNHASRLKTEMAVDQRTLWRSSHNRLVKIGERLNRIGKKINELGA